MDDDNKYDVTDMVVAAIEQKPLDFETAFQDVFIGKLRDAVENKKIQIAQQMYNYEPDDEEETDDAEAPEEETEEDNSEEELDDEES